jgi:hypothetical protein
VVLTSLASRIWIALTQGWPPLSTSEPFVILAAAGALCLVTAWIAGRVRNPDARRIVAWSVAIFAVGVALPWRYEVQRRTNWPASFKPVWEVTSRMPADPVFFVTEENGPKPILYRYHVIGGCFDRKFFPVEEEQITRADRPPKGYVVRVSDFYQHRLDEPGAQEALREFERRMERLGYEKVASNAFCTLMRPATDQRVAAGRVGTAIRERSQTPELWSRRTRR